MSCESSVSIFGRVVLEIIICQGTVMKNKHGELEGKMGLGYECGCVCGGWWRCGAED